VILQQQHQGCDEDTLILTDFIDHGNENIMGSSMLDALKEELVPPSPPIVSNE